VLVCEPSRSGIHSGRGKDGGDQTPLRPLIGQAAHGPTTATPGALHGAPGGGTFRGRRPLPRAPSRVYDALRGHSQSSPVVRLKLPESTAVKPTNKQAVVSIIGRQLDLVKGNTLADFAVRSETPARATCRLS